MTCCHSPGVFPTRLTSLSGLLSRSKAFHSLFEKGLRRGFEDTRGQFFSHRSFSQGRPALSRSVLIHLLQNRGTEMETDSQVLSFCLPGTVIHRGLHVSF